MKYLRKAHWYKNLMSQCLEYYPEAYVEEGTMDKEEPAVRIPMPAYWKLKEWMLENDPDRILRTDREEDLKIIHRLLDIMEANCQYETDVS